MSEEPNMLEEIASVMRRYGFRDVRFPSATATPEIFDGSIAFELKMTALIPADTVLSMGKDVMAELQQLDSRITGQGVIISKSQLGLKADSRQ